MRKFFVITGFAGIILVTLGVLFNPEYAGLPAYIAIALNLVSILLNGWDA